jgi:hypothetical protein
LAAASPATAGETTVAPEITARVSAAENTMTVRVPFHAYWFSCPVFHIESAFPELSGPLRH